MSEDDRIDSNTRVHVCQVCVGACDYVMSCQTSNDVAFQGPGCNGAYPILESPQ
jgi:hypothetical protein